LRDGLGRVRSLLILGGGSDIAIATAQRLVAAGTERVILAARVPDRLAAVEVELRRQGAAHVRRVAFDATDLEHHQDLLAGLFEEEGEVDVAVLAFGVLGPPGPRPAHRGAVEALAVNLVGAVSVLLPLVEQLTAQGHGDVVVLSSVAAVRPRPANLVYGSSKAGLDAFCLGLADSLAGTGVNLVLVRPGRVATKMTAHLPPAPLTAAPEAVAAAIERGLRDGARIVWVPPTVRLVAFALEWLPRSVLRRLQ
jgi:decaprenylphospho-beta-D-erythro-pentofuranosid-2-ulose 2-reductase